MRKGPTPYDEDELRRFRKLLEKKREEVVRQVEVLREEGLRRHDAELSDTPQHLADRASDEYERGQTIVRFESEQELLVQVDRALEKIDEGVYGICEESGEPIDRERLEAKPWARFCVRVQREHEQREG